MTNPVLLEAVLHARVEAATALQRAGLILTINPKALGLGWWGQSGVELTSL
jgi:hypothetical protein